MSGRGVREMCLINLMFNAMKTYVSYWGTTRAWWVVLVAGLLMVLAGFAYWFFPIAGYAVASALLGWLLIAVGVVKICVSAGSGPVNGRGWWLAGGILSLFVGFVLVRNYWLTQLIFPYLIALLLFYWGVLTLVAAITGSTRSGVTRGLRWVRVVSGVLLLVLCFMFLEAGFVQNVFNVTLLTSIAFIYWGFMLTTMAYDLRK